MILRERPEATRAPAGRAVRSPACQRAAALLLILLPACDCRADGIWSASLGATTDYILRGVSQTYGGAAVQLGANYQSSAGWFAGAWGSNVDPYPFANSSKELDLYGGFSWPLTADFSARATFTRYLYLHDPRPLKYDDSEFALTAVYLDRFAATVSYQPDSVSASRLGYARKRPSVGYELSGRWPIHGAFAVTGSAGYYDLQRLFAVSYWSGSAGLAYAHRRLEVDLTRFVSDHSVYRLYEDASANGTWVLSAVLRF